KGSTENSRRLASKIVLADISHNPHHRSPLLLPDDSDVLADGILTGPKLFGRGRTHEHDPGRFFSISVGQLPPLEQRDAHNFEVIGANCSCPEQRRFLLSRYERMSLQFNREEWNLGLGT